MNSNTLNRCIWCENTFDEYVKYHDEEWGVPVHDDKTHFEFLILEGAQAGLSWSTVLKKREGYRELFADFNVEAVAEFTTDEVETILQNLKVIRNRLKIVGTVINAQKFMEVQQEFGSFDKYIWSFVGGKPIINHRENMKQVPATTPESDALSKDLMKRGFKFVGSTIMYAHMQACGLVMDHTTDCFRYNQLV
jgi:DNA-3-methyladenine glycosylase I